MNCFVNAIIQFNGAYCFLVGIVLNFACYSFAIAIPSSLPAGRNGVFFPSSSSSGVRLSFFLLHSVAGCFMYIQWPLQSPLAHFDSATAPHEIGRKLGQIFWPLSMCSVSDGGNSVKYITCEFACTNCIPKHRLWRTHKTRHGNYLNGQAHSSSFEFNLLDRHGNSILYNFHTSPTLFLSLSCSFSLTLNIRHGPKVFYIPHENVDDFFFSPNCECARMHTVHLFSGALQLYSAAIVLNIPYLCTAHFMVFACARPLATTHFCVETISICWVSLHVHLCAVDVLLVGAVVMFLRLLSLFLDIWRVSTICLLPYSKIETHTHTHIPLALRECACVASDE